MLSCQIRPQRADVSLHLAATAIIVKSLITNARLGFLTDDTMAEPHTALITLASLTQAKISLGWARVAKSLGAPIRVAFLAAMVSACGANVEANYPSGSEDEMEDSGSLLDYFNFRAAAAKTAKPVKKSAPLGLAVNTDLWRASLDTLRFMPIASADPIGGTIITDWYNDPGTNGERLKINVVISGIELRADALRVSIFRERKTSGRWTSIAVSSRSAAQMENIILTRARDFKIARRVNP
jgi:hypothetical protein